MTQVKADIAQDLKLAMSAAEFDKAAKIGARILRMHPKRTDIQLMTAVSEMQGKNPLQAGQRLRRIFRTLLPNDRFFGPVSQNLLQYSYITNDFSSVELVMEERHRAAPQYSVFALMLADVIFRHQCKLSPGRSYAPKLAQAIELLENTAPSDPCYRDMQTLLARIYLYKEEHEKAFPLLENITQKQPQNRALRELLASSYAISGEVEKAVSTSLAIIHDFPDAGAQPFIIISFMRPQSMPENAREVLTEIAINPQNDAEQVYKASFALARMDEADGNMKSAFDWYQTGHAASRKARPIDMVAEFHEMNRVAEFARNAVADDLGDAKGASFEREDGPQPIFIVGMPRSGTTLTERILGAHPDVYAAGEIGDLSRVLAEVIGPCSFSEQIARLNKKTIAEIRKRYLAAMKAYAPNARFITNKTPANFLRLEAIRRIFPEAPIIHTHRHPLATCLSIYTTPFAVPMRFADDLGDLADYYRGYNTLMNVFFETDQHGMLYDLRYEELVANPESVAKDYLAHCGLDWHEQCLEFYRDGKTSTTASMIQVRRPINKDSLGKWQRFEPFIGPLADLVADIAVPDKKADKKSTRKTFAA